MAESAAVVSGLVAELRAAGDPERAPRERAYLKSDLEHWGVAVPTVRRIATAAVHPLDRSHLLAVVSDLWSAPVQERRLAASFALAARTELLDIRDAALLERLLRESRTWALVDVLSPKVVGPLRVSEPERWRPVLDRWAGDPDFWLRRAVLLSFLVRRGDPDDFAEFSGYADALLDDREFFVAKAIGWVLRDTGRRRPDLVADWVVPRAERMRSVSLREAIKPLPVDARHVIEQTLATRRRRPTG